MKKILIFVFLLSSLCMRGQELSGDWKGLLKAGPQTLTLVLHIDRVSQSVTMDVVEQGAYSLPATLNILTSDSLSISIARLGLSYSGRVKEGKLRGIFQQNLFKTSLDFEPGQVEVNRPQEPKPPFPYTTEEVVFHNYPAQAMLAGTLTFPIGYENGTCDKVPVVVMVSGSGQQNRDEEMFGHKPFLVIADWLARHGIASLRYDDRGTGASIGDYKSCTTRDFYMDAYAAIDILKRRNEFSSIGIIGHSEGGAIAYMLGSEGVVDFIISLAGPACKIDEMMVVQLNALAHSQGVANDIVHSPEEAYAFIKSQNGESAWLDYFFDMDMTEYVEKVKCPVLALGGERDLNVPVSINVPALEQHLPSNEHNRIKVYPELSHLFQHSPTGNPLIAASIEETISEEVLKDIVEFVVLVNE